MKFRLSGAQDFIELTILEAIDSPESAGDARLNVEVQSSGFRGIGNVWVDADSLRQFCGELVKLEMTRSGEARLDSMSPSELMLIIKAVDSLGHLGIFGSVGRHVHAEHGSILHSVTFGFEFDPNLLREASNVDWLNGNST